MRIKEKKLIIGTVTFIFATLGMGLIIYGIAKENDNMRKKIDRLEYMLRECVEKQNN